MITYDFLPLHEIAFEVQDDVARHIAMMEKEDQEDYGDPNIDWDSYLALSHLGKCWVATARYNGKLIGYSCFALTQNLRHKHLLEAYSQGLFVEKLYRGEVGPALVKKADENLKSMGVTEAKYVMSNERAGKMLERCGDYKPTQTVWVKRYG